DPGAAPGREDWSPSPGRSPRHLTGHATSGSGATPSPAVAGAEPPAPGGGRGRRPGSPGPPPPFSLPPPGAQVRLDEEIQVPVHDRLDVARLGLGPVVLHHGVRR